MSKNIFVLQKKYEYMLEKLYKENRICLKEVDAINNYVKNLQEIYNKAIEYIETYIDFEDSSKLDTKKELKELSDILKGGNNE